MDTLSSRLAFAMGEMQAPELASRIGVTKQTIYNLLDGVTKPDKVRAVTLFDVARALGIAPIWLLYGRGRMNRDWSTDFPAEEPGAASQIPKLEPAILARAEFWVRIEERAAGAYPDLRRAERIIALCQMVQADGGDLSAEHAIELVEAARSQGEIRGRSNTAATAGTAGE